MPDTKPQLYSALIKAQEAMGPVKKEARGNYGKYATLDTVLETIDKPLHDNDLLYTQLVQVEATGPNLITRLIHAPTGESIESVYPIVSKDPNDPQKIGGSLTYARRYSLMALLGLAPEDDDGTAASTPANTTQPSAPQRPTSAPAAMPVREVNTQTGEITNDPLCPDCGGQMWDNRAKKASGEYAANRPDFSCKKRGGNPDCKGAIWPPKDQADGRQREDDGMRTRSTVDELADIDEAAEIFGDMPPYRDSDR